MYHFILSNCNYKIINNLIKSNPTLIENKENVIVFFDIEHNSIGSPSKPYAIAAILQNDGHIYQFNILMKVEGPFNQYSLKITGLDQVIYDKNLPSMKDGLQKFANFLIKRSEKKNIIFFAHNAYSSDANIVCRNMILSEIDFPIHQHIWIDTINLLTKKELINKKEKYGIKDLLKKFTKLNLEQHHNPYADALYLNILMGTLIKERKISLKEIINEADKIIKKSPHLKNEFQIVLQLRGAYPTSVNLPILKKMHKKILKGERTCGDLFKTESDVPSKRGKKRIRI